MKLVLYVLIGLTAVAMFAYAEMPQVGQVAPGEVMGGETVVFSGVGETAVSQTALSGEGDADIGAAAQNDALPARLVSSEIGLDVAIVPTALENTPATTAGWWSDSARPGDGGNVVVWGHNFSAMGPLERAVLGNQVDVYMSDGLVYQYQLVDRVIVVEAGQPLEVRQANGRYITQMGSERLTLVTCWPFPAADTHRLILVGELIGVIRVH